MKQLITAKLKLLTTHEQHRALRETGLAYRDALHATSAYAFAHGKTSSRIALHKGMYREVRVCYRLPSQLACSVMRQVAGTYKGLWTKLMQNVEHRRKKITKKRFRGLDKPPRYTSPTLQYTYERDYTLKSEQCVSLITLNGRITVSYQGYHPHIALLAHATVSDARLWYDKPKRCFYLLVPLEIEVPEPAVERYRQVVGVDVGIR
jgi:putative transposase